MSCYEWERGSFKLSVKEYRKFRQEFRKGWNESMDAAHAHAHRIYNEVLGANHGKRGVDWWKAVYEHHLYLGGYGVRGYQSSVSTLELDHGQMIVASLGFKGEGNTGKRPCAPKKKDFPHATRDQMTYCEPLEDCEVTFDDAVRVIVWHVRDNNHACERARASFIGRLFFKLLNKIEWTRGTGGKIIGNNEYSRDSYEEGGGGNTVNGEWGPREQKAQRAAEARAAWVPVPGFSWRSAGW